jgi:hypothetical protein
MGVGRNFVPAESDAIGKSYTRQGGIYRCCERKQMVARTGKIDSYRRMKTATYLHMQTAVRMQELLRAVMVASDQWQSERCL